MIVGPRAKQALLAKVEAADTGFTFVDNDRQFEPKLWMFLDASLVESTTQFEAGDACYPALRDVTERSSVFIYAAAIADDDGQTTASIETDVALFVARLMQLVAVDVTLGLGPGGADEMAGVQFVNCRIVTNETSTRQMQTAGGQPFNACRAFLELEVEAVLDIASLATS